MRHREEEDALYRQFAKKRAEEESCISQQIQEEWELELERLTSRFQHELGTKKSRKLISSDEERALTVRLQHEKADLEKNMTIKLDRKKGSITKKLLEQERQATAELVDKHSREMIHLINEKLEQFKQVRRMHATPQHLHDRITPSLLSDERPAGHSSPPVGRRHPLPEPTAAAIPSFRLQDGNLFRSQCLQ